MLSMIKLAQILGLAFIFLHCWRITNNTNISSRIVVCTVAILSSIVFSGYIASALQLYSTVSAWTIGICIVACSVVYVSQVSGSQHYPLNTTHNIALPRHHELAALLILYSIICALSLLNAIRIANVAPDNADSLAHHLPRMLFYLQYDSIQRFPANYWAQTDHAKNAVILKTYFYLLFGRSENAASLPQYLSYHILAISIYSISRIIGTSIFSASLSAALSLLSINALLEATTAQDDLVFCAFAATALVCFLTAISQNGSSRWFIGLGASFGLALGTKISALTLLPSFAVLVLAWFFCSTKVSLHSKLRTLVLAVLSVTVGAAVFALPAGYLENLVNYGSPVGGPETAIHKYPAGTDLSSRILAGFANAARFSIELMRPDGLPSSLPVTGWLDIFQHWLAQFLGPLGIDIINAPYVAPFSPPQGMFLRAHEDVTYIGPAFALIVLPCMIMALFVRDRNFWLRPFIFSALAFIITQAFVGPYDPWRGRYFIGLLIFVLPIVAMIFDRFRYSYLAFAWISIAMGIVCWAAFNAVLLRHYTNGTRNLYASREKQISQFVIPIEVLRKYEKHVPENATVILPPLPILGDYLFFGRQGSRFIIPESAIGTAWQRGKTPDFKLLGPTTRAEPTDIALGRGYHLRDLRPQNNPDWQDD